MKEYSEQDSERDIPVVTFRLEEGSAEEANTYFRDLSENYSDYVRGIKPWPARPAGLISTLDDRFAQEETA